MADVFISYKAEDRERVRPLAAAIEDLGLSVWWDVHLDGGDEWREEIQHNLTIAKCVLVVWTTLSAGPEGRFVRDEASWAVRHGTYVPARLDNVQMPLGFGEIQAFPLLNWKGAAEDPQFAAIADAVKARVEGRTKIHHAVVAEARRFDRRTLFIGGSVLGIAGLSGAAYWLSGGLQDTAVRIAVLPLDNLSNDESQTYFSGGLAEELRAALSRIGLEVIGRKSSEGFEGKDLAEIASKLKVSHVLSGSVRKSDTIIRVAIQLVECASGVEKWAGNYDRPVTELIAVQTDISEKVANALSLSLGSALRKTIELGGTSDHIAQDLYLQALELSLLQGNNEENFRKEIAMLDKAIARDGKFANALVERGRRDTNIAVSFGETQEKMAELLNSAERFIRAGLAAVPGLALGYSAMAEVDAGRLDFRQTLINGRKAFELAPKDINIIGMLMNTMIYLAPVTEVEVLVSTMSLLDPLNPEGNAVVSAGNLILGKGDEAIAAAKRCANLLPDNPYAKYQLALSNLTVGKVDDAAKVLADAPAEDLYFDTLKALVAARKNQHDDAAKILKAMRAHAGELGSYQYAQVLTATGDFDGAFKDLQTAVRVRDPGLLMLKRDPFFEPLFDDPRFAEILARLDFPTA